MVSKLTGQIKEAGTALPTEHYVRQFEATSEKSALGGGSGGPWAVQVMSDLN